MNDTQIGLVQRSFAQVRPIAIPAARLFYTRLFELDPSLRPLFRGDVEEQGRKLMAALGLVVSGLTHLETLLPAVQSLGARHAGYGVKDEHYTTVGDALLWTLQQGLGEAFTPEVHDAWSAAYTVLASVMREASHSALTPHTAGRGLR